MPDPRFFLAEGPFTLRELAIIAGVDISSSSDENALFEDVAPLNLATPKQVSFLDNSKYLSDFQATKAGVCILSKQFADQIPEGTIPLIAKDPYRTYAKIAQAFYPRPKIVPNISDRAHIAKSAVVDATCRIDPGAFIDVDAEVGGGSWVGPNSILGRIGICGTDWQRLASSR